MIDTALIKIGAGVLLVLAIFGAGHHFGARGVQADWDADKLGYAEAEKKAVGEAIAKRDAEHAKSIKITHEELKTYERTIADQDRTITAERARADANRMRITIPARHCPAPAGQAASPDPVHGAPASETIELPGDVEGRLLNLAEDADRELGRCDAKLSGLQNWVIKHGMYGLDQTVTE